jgi:hypothetical protein
VRAGRAAAALAAAGLLVACSDDGTADELATSTDVDHSMRSFQ